jgi:hypothetical protein
MVFVLLFGCGACVAFASRRLAFVSALGPEARASFCRASLCRAFLHSMSPQKLIFCEHLQFAEHCS